MDPKTYLNKENVEFIREPTLVQKSLLKKSDSLENSDNSTLIVKFSVTGAIDLEKIESAWHATVDSLTSLRTVFRKARNRTVQVILKELSIPFIVVKTENEIDDSFKSLSKVLDQNDLQVIDLTKPPLVKILLVLGNSDNAVFVISSHRSVIDKSGLTSVFEELLMNYENALIENSSKSVDRPPFTDYMDWHDEQYLQPAIDFWDRELEEFETPTSLFEFQHFNHESNDNSKLYTDCLTQKKSKELNGLAKKLSVGPAQIIETAWAILLRFYSLEEIVTFGCEYRHPPQKEKQFKNLIGAFTNTLPVSISLNKEEIISDLIFRIKQKHEENNVYSFIPLDEIPIEDEISSKSPFFESSVSVYQNHLPQKARNCPVDVHNMDLWQDHQGLSLDATCNSKWHFKLSSSDGDIPIKVLERIVVHFKTILSVICDHPDLTLSELTFLTNQDTKKLGKINKSPIKNNPSSQLFQEIFEEQAEKYPSSVACRFEDFNISYQELNERSNQLAHWLRQQNIGRNDLAAVLANRNIEMLITILAVFKAGAAYIPLDPSDPYARLEGMVIDSEVKVLFSGPQVLDRTQKIAEKSPQKPLVFCLEEKNTDVQHDVPTFSSISSQSKENPELINTAEDLAYIIFTSGSTGNPKGAMVAHKGMINHLWCKVDLLELTSSSIVAQNATHCFDISVWQMLTALMVGGQTIIYGNETAIDPINLFKSVQMHRVTILEMVPSLLESYLQSDIHHLKNPDLPDLIYLLSTGENLPALVAKNWIKKYPQIPVINAYGPTECSDDTHHFVMKREDDLDDCYHDVPIGRIIPNFRCYILGEYNQQVPLGCPGEICLTGIGVGKGYINNQAKTAAAFVKNPFSDGFSDLMYRTGDLGYFDQNDDLIFLGRIDNQVKVRGHRIELGEIDSRLRKHSAIKQCITIIKGKAADSQILTFVVLKNEISLDQLKDYLRQQIPNYMIPDYIQELERLPLNKNGKIDQKILKNLSHSALGNADIVSPQNEIEEILVEIWEEVLDVKPIGTNQNFFELGGHSLKIIKMRSRIGQLLNVETSVIELFQHKTITETAQFIEKKVKEGKRTPNQRSIPKQDDNSFYPMSHAQKRLFFLNQIEFESRHYNLPTALEFHGVLDISCFQNALQSIVDRHASLRTTFGIQGYDSVQYIAKSQTVAFDHEILFESKPDNWKQSVDERLEREINHYFDLAVGPLFYSKSFQLGPDHYLLFFNMHHIVGDLWSWEILFKELFSAYHQFINEKPLSLPSIPIQYYDYSVWQKQRIDEGKLTVHEQYWKTKLEGSLPQIALATDYTPSATQDFEAGTLIQAVPQDCLQQAQKVFRENRVTNFVGLLSIFYTFLTRITNQQDIIIGTVEAGRNRVELEDIIGFFINTLPIRINLNESITFTEVLEEVRKLTLESFEHSEYPFDRIVSQLDLERDLNSHPLFKVMFQVNDNENHSKLSPDFPISYYPTEKQITNLALHVVFNFNEAGYDCHFVYRKDLFKEATIKRWMNHFMTFMRNMLFSPHEKVSFHSLLTESEENIIVEQWNHTSVEHPDDQLVHAMVETQADRNPGQTGIEFKDRAIDYVDINQRANQIAHCLLSKSLPVGSRIGVYLNRSPDLIFAVLGILKAGHSYVPLDTKLPVLRLKHIVSDSTLQCIISNQNRDPSVYEEFSDLEWIDVGLIDDSFSTTNPDIDIDTKDLAYVIYTSGTTGMPKGIPITLSSWNE